MKVLGLCVLLGLIGCSGVGAPDHELIFKQARLRLVHIPGDYGQEQIRAVAKEVCGYGDVCVAVFWRDRSMVPRRNRSTPEQNKAKYAYYNLNKGSGLDRVRICSLEQC